MWFSPPKVDFEEKKKEVDFGVMRLAKEVPMTSLLSA